MITITTSKQVNPRFNQGGFQTWSFLGGEELACFVTDYPLWASRLSYQFMRVNLHIRALATARAYTIRSPL